MNSIVIVGAGECGVNAAFALRAEGYEGGITLIGAEHDLPYERPPLSKSGSELHIPLRKAEAFEDAGILLKLGETVDEIDIQNRRVHCLRSGALPYNSLLLATGSRARTFPGMERCRVLRTMQDAKSIKAHFKEGARIGIIGGGFIGLELAATARTNGAQVTVFEAAPHLMARAVPKELAEVLAQKHAEAGVDLCMSSLVASADENTVTLVNGDCHEFDVVISGVGNVPNVGLAVRAGIAVDNGILVDERLQTSVDNIFAAGDCCSLPWRNSRYRFESVSAAQNQGMAVAKSMLGHTAQYDVVPWFWSDQYDQTLQVAGVFEPNLPVHAREADDNSCLLVQVDMSGRICAAAGVGRGNAASKDIRVLIKLIERQAIVPVDRLVDCSVKLKSLLKAA